MKKENEEKIKEEKDAIEKSKKKQGKFFNEFKEFALRGNVLDLFNRYNKFFDNGICNIYACESYE